MVLCVIARVGWMRKLLGEIQSAAQSKSHTHMRTSSSLARITHTTISSSSKKRRRSRTTRTSSNTQDENPLYSALDDMTGGDEEATRYAKFEYVPNEETWRAKARWNWGSPVGTAHECAKVCRTKFYVEQARALFLEHFTIRDRHDREELKLVLALLMQREGHETGDPNGWNENVAKRLVNAEFEDEEKGFESFVECVRAQVGVEESAGEREVLAKALETLRFVERGP